MDELLFGELPPEPPGHRRLVDMYVVPPFSVLDTRQEYWRERRRSWLTLGIQSEIGRGYDLLQTGANSVYNGGSAWSGIRGQAVQSGPARAFSQDLMRGEVRYSSRSLHELAGRAELAPSTAAISATVQGAGTSIFDPVLCELVYRWWCPAGGSVLDPFAGGSVRGIVAGMLGHPYHGLDLSPRQVEANRQQGRQIIGPGLPMPTWEVADSRALSPTGEGFDLVFTCPPYYDLEIYSDDPADLSAMATYGEFLAAYADIIAAAAARLRSDRCMVLVVSEIRDRRGYCRGLVPDTVRLAQAAGLGLYNDAILLNSAGSAPVRADAYMAAARKLVRVHQNVLVFVKGDPERGWSHEREAPPDPQIELWGQ